MGQGRAHKKAEKIRYRAQDLKAINRMCEEIFGKRLKSIDMYELDELFKIEIGEPSYIKASKVAKDEKYFKGKKVFFVTEDQHKIQIPKELKPLLCLALHYTCHSYSKDNGDIYIPPLTLPKNKP